jgi:putative acetyltransferase
MRQKIGLVALVVRDYDEAIAYFTDKLGFTLVEDTPLGGGKRWVVVMPAGSAGTGLLLARAAGEEQRGAIGHQTGGRVFLFLHTDDFRRDHAGYRERGVRFVEEPRHEPYGTVAVFEDLYGNRWDLIEVKPMDDLAISIETPLQDDVRGLVAELNATLLELTPPEFVFHMTVEQMAAADTAVFVARDRGVAVACGALKRHAGGIGEVKRMYTRPSHRGRKIGAMIVQRIEALARQEGCRRLVLETGDRHPAAWTVYERAGFTRCGPVLDYPDSEWSVFYEKSLAA